MVILQVKLQTLGEFLPLLPGHTIDIEKPRWCTLDL